MPQAVASGDVKHITCGAGWSPRRDPLLRTRTRRTSARRRAARQRWPRLPPAPRVSGAAYEHRRLPTRLARPAPATDEKRSKQTPAPSPQRRRIGRAKGKSNRRPIHGGVFPWDAELPKITRLQSSAEKGTARRDLPACCIAPTSSKEFAIGTHGGKRRLGHAPAFESTVQACAQTEATLMAYDQTLATYRLTELEVFHAVDDNFTSLRPAQLPAVSLHRVTRLTLSINGRRARVTTFSARASLPSRLSFEKIAFMVTVWRPIKGR
jgi:hypothetical protein